MCIRDRLLEADVHAAKLTSNRAWHGTKWEALFDLNAMAAQHAKNMTEPHLTQMRLALTDISSDPAELCALPQMISLTAQGIAEAAKGSQSQCTEELQREMRSLAFKKMWWKLDKFEAHSNRNLYRYRNTI